MQKNSAVESLYNAGKYKDAYDDVNFLLKQYPNNSELYLARIIICIALAKDSTENVNLSRSELVKMISNDSVTLSQLNPNWIKDNTIKQGYMKKGGEYNRLKKKRWFVLTIPLLFYFSNKEVCILNLLCLFLIIFSFF